MARIAIASTVKNPRYHYHYGYFACRDDFIDQAFDKLKQYSYSMKLTRIGNQALVFAPYFPSEYTNRQMYFSRYYCGMQQYNSNRSLIPNTPVERFSPTGKKRVWLDAEKIGNVMVVPVPKQVQLFWNGLEEFNAEMNDVDRFELAWLLEDDPKMHTAPEDYKPKLCYKGFPGRNIETGWGVCFDLKHETTPT